MKFKKTSSGRNQPAHSSKFLTNIKGRNQRRKQQRQQKKQKRALFAARLKEKNSENQSTISIKKKLQQLKEFVDGEKKKVKAGKMDPHTVKSSPGKIKKIVKGKSSKGTGIGKSTLPKQPLEKSEGFKISSSSTDRMSRLQEYVNQEAGTSRMDDHSEKSNKKIGQIESKSFDEEGNLIRDKRKLKSLRKDQQDDTKEINKLAKLLGYKKPHQKKKVAPIFSDDFGGLLEDIEEGTMVNANKYKANEDEAYDSDDEFERDMAIALGQVEVKNLKNKGKNKGLKTKQKMESTSKDFKMGDDNEGEEFSDEGEIYYEEERSNRDTDEDEVYYEEVSNRDTREGKVYYEEASNRDTDEGEVYYEEEASNKDTDEGEVYYEEGSNRDTDEGEVYYEEEASNKDTDEGEVYYEEGSNRDTDEGEVYYEEPSNNETGGKELFYDYSDSEVSSDSDGMRGKEYDSNASERLALEDSENSKEEYDTDTTENMAFNNNVPSFDRIGTGQYRDLNGTEDFDTDTMENMNNAPLRKACVNPRRKDNISDEYGDELTDVPSDEEYGDELTEASSDDEGREQHQGLLDSEAEECDEEESECDEELVHDFRDEPEFAFEGGSGYYSKPQILKNGQENDIDRYSSNSDDDEDLEDFVVGDDEVQFENVSDELPSEFSDSSPKKMKRIITSSDSDDGDDEGVHNIPLLPWMKKGKLKDMRSKKPEKATGKKRKRIFIIDDDEDEEDKKKIIGTSDDENEVTVPIICNSNSEEPEETIHTKKRTLNDVSSSSTEEPEITYKKKKKTVIDDDDSKGSEDEPEITGKKKKKSIIDNNDDDTKGSVEEPEITGKKKKKSIIDNNDDDTKGSVEEPEITGKKKSIIDNNDDDSKGSVEEPEITGKKKSIIDNNDDDSKGSVEEPEITGKKKKSLIDNNDDDSKGSVEEPEITGKKKKKKSLIDNNDDDSKGSVEEPEITGKKNKTIDEGNDSTEDDTDIDPQGNKRHLLEKVSDDKGETDTLAQRLGNKHSKMTLKKKQKMFSGDQPPLDCKNKKDFFHIPIISEDEAGIGPVNKKANEENFGKVLQKRAQIASSCKRNQAGKYLSIPVISDESDDETQEKSHLSDGDHSPGSAKFSEAEESAGSAEFSEAEEESAGSAEFSEAEEESAGSAEFSEAEKESAGSAEFSEAEDDTLASAKFSKNKENSQGVTSKGENQQQEEDGVTEDIYGRLRDKEGNVIENKKDAAGDGKYIPPALRKLMALDTDEKKKEQLANLKKTLKGLLNRLAESNMAGIASQIEGLYIKYSRNDMNDILTNLFMDSLVAPSLTPERLVQEHVMLVAILSANVGNEVGAHIMNEFVIRWNDEMGCLVPGENDVTKEVDNLLLVIANLYNFRVMDPQLVYDILHKLTIGFTDKEVELILLVLRSVGFTLRKDDPLALKSLITEIQAQASIAQAKNEGNVEISRVRFMLEVLQAIRNNNMAKMPNYDPSNVEHLKKVLKGLVRKGMHSTPLNVSLEDLLKARECGRWWIVGSAWSGDLPGEKLPLGQRQLDIANKNKVLENKFSEKFKERAGKLQLSRPPRINILYIITEGSEDYLDAFEKLLQLSLPSQQERELFNVILLCSQKSKVYNPFFAHLADRMCKFDKKFKRLLQFALWDKFTVIEAMNPRETANLGKFVTHLIGENGINLSVFKNISFMEVSSQMISFLRQTLIALILHPAGADAVERIFSELCASPKLHMLRQSLRIFILKFLRTKKTGNVNQKMLAKRIQDVIEVLSKGGGVKL
ncbi:uncharacterized protein LOC121878583 [Homarus americanus]|uniref:Nucleolar MIF4G domain-containing protein 1-like n=1 Tax=Homarus americanus TaxID=6706 RepID=A0A8J5JJR1_HOMAM|nr:uncharacterized protein LOC121878583 [Homarus americanus]KAG7158581.1 Nucleolar MIF4G domain-containing protein 1-like [Homarus americanus]